MPNVLVDEAFLPPAACARLVEDLRAAAEGSGDVFATRYRTEMAAWIVLEEGPAELRNQLGAIRERARQALAAAYAPDDALHVELTLFTEMRDGDRHPLHADAERRDDAGGWEPNHTGWRHSVALLYLNTAGADFDGGTLVLPELGVTLPPRAGELVGFPATRDFLHEVTPITRGSRCTLAMWMTLDPERREAWDGG